jgi:glycosyltransferase involved in cell wall biosynthesis
MRIAIDATLVGPGMSGIGYSVEHLARALAETGELDEIILLSNRRPASNQELPQSLRWESRCRFPFRAPWMQFLLPFVLRRVGADLTHYPNFLAPVLYKHPYVVTFHDMSVYRHPESVTWQKRHLTRALLPRVAGGARAILTVTDAMRSDIHEVLGVPLGKIFAVHHAPGDRFHRFAREIEAGTARRGDQGEAPYILFVGNVEPRKNLIRLLDAFEILKSGTNLPHELRLAGGAGWKSAPLLAKLRCMNHRGAVRFLGYVPAGELPALYAGAALFVFPSIYEGFGVPPLEAMCCGTPVVASGIAAHREVLADAALLVDPSDPRAIAEGIRGVLQDAGLAAELRRKGSERVKRYTWRRTARETLRVYRNVLGR